MIVHKNTSFHFFWVNIYSTMRPKSKNKDKMLFITSIFFRFYFVLLPFKIFCQWTFFHRRNRRKQVPKIWLCRSSKISKSFELSCSKNFFVRKILNPGYCRIFLVCFLNNTFFFKGKTHFDLFVEERTEIGIFYNVFFFPKFAENLKNSFVL